MPVLPPPLTPEKEADFVMESIVCPSSSAKVVFGVSPCPGCMDPKSRWLLCPDSQDQRKGVSLEDAGQASNKTRAIRFGKGRIWWGAKNKEQHRKKETSWRKAEGLMQGSCNFIFQGSSGSSWILNEHLLLATKRHPQGLYLYIFY